MSRPSRGAGAQCDQQALHDYADCNAAARESEELVVTKGTGKCCDYVSQYAWQYNSQSVMLNLANK